MAGATHLVIGGGLIGSHVALALAREGRPVTVLSRSFNPVLTEAGEEGVRLVPGEVADDEALNGPIEEAEVVFFLAGSSTPALSEADAGESMRGLVTPALAVMEAMRRSPAKRLVVASSGGTVYGVQDDPPTPEDAPTNPISGHGNNSLMVEQYAAFYAREHGLEPVVLRFSNVYGPGGRSRNQQGVIAAWLERVARGEAVPLVGDGTVSRDFLYVEDAAGAAAAASERARPGTYNVGSGTPTSMTELLEVIRSVTGRDVEVEHQPARSIDVPVTALDCTRLREETSWSPRVGLSEGVSATWEWMRSR